MKSLRRNWWKVVIIVSVCVLLDLSLHLLMSSIIPSNTSVFKPSIFVKKGLLVPSLFAYSFIDFGLLSMLFIFIQDNLPNKKWIKGLLYGLSFGALYFTGMFEGILILNDTILNSFLMGISDLFPILFMGILLGIFTGNYTSKNQEAQNVFTIIIVTLFFIIGRYFSYSILNINSAYIIKPLGTFVWTLCQGLCIGILYFILQSGIRGKSIILQALFFGVVIFGLNWLVYHLFLSIIAEVSFIDIFKRVGTDVLFTTLGVLVCKKFYAKK